MLKVVEDYKKDGRSFKCFYV